MPSKSTKADEPTFENALDQLEDLVEQLESDDLTMDEALDAYERGVSLADRCQDHLDDAEVRIEELSNST